jgi:hypothetical protein
MTTAKSPSNPKLLASWDASKQDAWRSQRTQDVALYHFVLDASPSMHPYQRDLMRAYNTYLSWLQRAAHPMSLAEIFTFDLQLHRLSSMQALGAVQALTAESYQPLRGHGTALYNAVGQVCSTATQQGQHVLVVFTDGEDGAPEPVWTASQCRELLTTLQEHTGWLCVFLGAFPKALNVARSMGFHAGNCLTFPGDQIPQAFAHLRRATQRYLAAPVPERPLLASAGIFAGDASCS